MTLRSRLTGTALVLTLSGLGLVACGSDEDGADAEATDTPSQTEDGAEGEAEGGKPSRQEVIDGYAKLVSDQVGDMDLPADTLETVVTCFVDELYDDASPATLNGLADSDPDAVDPDDTTLFTEANATCQQPAAG